MIIMIIMTIVIIMIMNYESMVCNQFLENQMTKTMLDELTIEANEESFVIVLQHDGNDVR